MGQVVKWNERQIHLKVWPLWPFLIDGKVTLKSQSSLPLCMCRRYLEFIDFFSVNRRSLSVGTTEGSASAEWTTEGSAESLAEGTFGRSLVLCKDYKASRSVRDDKAFFDAKRPFSRARQFLFNVLP